MVVTDPQKGGQNIKRVDQGAIPEAAGKKGDEQLSQKEAGEYVKDEAARIGERVMQIAKFFEIPQEDQVDFLVRVLVENQHYKEKVDNLHIDETTGLHVKKFYEEMALMMLNKELRLAEASNKLEDQTGMELPQNKSSVVLIDLDFFKKVNDTYGHLAGDFVLGEVGKMINETFRMSDIKGRYGGEEMIVVLPGCNEADARKRAEDLRVRLKDTTLVYKDTKGEEIPINITLSAGLSSINMTEASRVGYQAQEVYKLLKAKADSNLYDAKKFGRNRVVGGSVDLPAAATAAAESAAGESTGESASTTPTA